MQARLCLGQLAACAPSMQGLYIGSDNSISIHFSPGRPKATRMKIASVLHCHQQEMSKTKFQKVEQQLHRACDQITLLQCKARDLRTRHTRAQRSQDSVFCGSLCLQLAVVENACAMYHEYACRKTEQLLQIHCLIHGVQPQDVWMSTS